MLSRRTLSALAAMLDVARLGRQRPAAGQALAPPGGLAPRQLETVLQDLVRAGLLRGIRGPLGGYELARERRRISAGDIVRAIGEAYDAHPAGPGQAAIKAAVAGATAAFLAHLDEVSLEDLCRRAEAGRAEGRGGVADFHI